MFCDPDPHLALTLGLVPLTTQFLFNAPLQIINVLIPWFANDR